MKIVREGDSVVYPVITDRALQGRDAILCGECGVHMTKGAPYSQRPKEVRGKKLVMSIMCVYCDLEIANDADNLERH